MGKIFSGILGIFVLVSLIPAASAVEARFFVTEVTPQQIEPGGVTTLNITVKNMGSGPAGYATYVRASLDPSDTSPIDPIGIGEMFLTKKAVEAQGAQGFFGVVLQEEELKISFPIYATLNTTEDVYDVPLFMEWKDNKLVDKNQTILIGIRVKGYISLGIVKVRTNPQELKRDTENSDVTVTVENSGKAAAKSVTVKLALKEPFSEAYSNSDSDFVAEIAKDKTHDFTLSVDIDEKAEAGSYAFLLTVTYRDEERDYVLTEELVLVVESEANFEVRDVKTNPEPIKPGDDFRINVLMVNDGQRDAESVKAVLKTKSYFTGVKTDYLGDIKVGESKLATFELTADRDTIPDNYENDIKIIWSEGDKRLEEIDSFGITVSGGQSEGGVPMKAVAGLAVLAVVVGLVMWRRRR